MAVDTALKRFSMIEMAACGARALLPPSGTVTAVERLLFSYQYASLLSSASSALKRFSMIEIAASGVRILPPPSGTVSTGERQMFSYQYAAPTSPPPPPPGITVVQLRRGMPRGLTRGIRAE